MSPATLLAISHLLLTVAAQQWRLIHEYPAAEKNNFTFVRLTCTEHDDDFQTPLKNATFMWNVGNDSEDVMMISTMRAEADDAGSVTIMLTQEYEGNYTCVGPNGTSDAVPLAAQPPSFDNITVVNITVTDKLDVVAIPLSCLIQPGRHKDKYHVTWKEFYSDRKVVILSTESFNISVNMSLPMANIVVYYYACEVEVVYDASHSATYPGGKFRIMMKYGDPSSIANNPESVTKEPDHSKDQSTIILLAVGVCGVCIVATLAIVALKLLLVFNRKSKYTARKCTTTKCTTNASLRWSCAEAGGYRATTEQTREQGLALTEQELQMREQELATREPEERELRQAEVSLQQVQVQFELTSDDDDNDSDSARVVSSMNVSDDVSFSPDIYGNKTSVSTPCFEYVFETLLQNAPSRPKASALLEPFSPPLESAAYRSTESCRNLWDSECTNPHCKCHQLRMQALLNPKQIRHSAIVGTNSVKCMAPDFMHRTYALQDCTSKGLMHTDEEFGFVIEIPEGAVPQGMRLTIDVAISLHGPFRYPHKVRRISPIVWVCARDFDNFQFLKPVKVSLQHCLIVNKSDDLDSLGVRFLKAGHSCDESGLYSFQPADGTIEPGLRDDYLTLLTTHFCYMCLVSNERPDTQAKMKYCLTTFHPDPVFQKDNDKIHHYVSFFLNACLVTINKQCGKGLKKLPPRGFHFTRDNCLTIQFEEPENWILALESNEEITADDVDFQHKDPQELIMEEREGMYPPKFTVRAHPLPDAQLSKVRFNFSGGEKRMAMDILLLTEAHRGKAERVTQLQLPGDYRRSSSPSVSPEPSPSILSSPLRAQDSTVPLHAFMEHVAVHARTKWRFFGIMIDIPPDVLDSFPGHDCLQAFSRVFGFWVRRADPFVTWEAIASVLESDTVDEKKLGDDIRRNFVPCVVPQPRVMDRSVSTYSRQTRSTDDTGYGSQSRSDSTPMMRVSDV